MPTAGTASSAVESAVERDDDAIDEENVVVCNCSRLGLTANPPGFSLLDVFRRLRRRR